VVEKKVPHSGSLSFNCIVNLCSKFTINELRMDVDWVSTALHAERRINEDLRGIRLNLEGELDHLHHNSSDPHPRPIPGA